MLDVLLVVSVLLLLMTMVMLIMVLQSLGGKLETTEDELDYWRQKALTNNYEALNHRYSQSQWQD